MGLEGAEVGGLNSSHGEKLKGGKPQSQREGASFMEDLTPHLLYQNYLPISASFDLNRVLLYALHNIPSC